MFPFRFSVNRSSVQRFPFLRQISAILLGGPGPAVDICGAPPQQPFGQDAACVGRLGIHFNGKKKREREAERRKKTTNEQTNQGRGRKLKKQTRNRAKWKLGLQQHATDPETNARHVQGAQSGHFYPKRLPGNEKVGGGSERESKSA